MGWSFARTPFLIAGPCVVEPGDVLPRVAETLARIGAARGLPVCFKASFDKANRARRDAPRGPGLEEGLRVLERVRAASGLPVLTDIHEPAQAAPAAEVADALQIPAFLCRQTDLLIAAGHTGRPVNVKKGQWMQAEAMAGALDKVRSGGSTDVAVTERGTFFGYGDLVVDVRNFARLRAATGAAVVFDATHAVQQPGQGTGGVSGGQREHIPALLAAAAVAGADGFFVATQWPLDRLDALIGRTLDLWARAHD
jgi:2-dehydro-3-deoxyphosphooctonate aldolase (KDO 8-P synthase)